MSAPADGQAWTQHRERSNLATLRLMRWIATALGRRVARVVLWPIALYFLVFGGAAARASRDYLARVLGRPPRWVERYRHIHHFAATVLDRVYLLMGQLHHFDLQVSGMDAFDALLLDGEGVLLIGAHLGSFEALRAIGQQRRGLRIAMVMYEDNARQINATLQAIAPDARLHVIALGRLEAMLQLREWLDGGGVAGMLGDRTLPGSAQRSHSHTLDFLGQPARFADGPFRLAALLRRPVLFMTGLYQGGSGYELRFVPLADFRQRAPNAAAQDAAIRAALARYVALLEGLCRESPYNWFNFFDFWAGAKAADSLAIPSAAPAAAPDRDPSAHAVHPS
ncbi:MAG TPA: acyl-CoA synthetase [Burkholderiaceae bacterium]|nr:acyl-CoA synthetase [Burkholderiaceae bacterium]HNB47068.1 acyl-CoA synthetase [Burkholderiaceae bacterium]